MPKLGQFGSIHWEMGCFKLPVSIKVVNKVASALDFVKISAMLCAEPTCATFERSPFVYVSLIAAISMSRRFSDTVDRFVIVSKRHLESVNNNVLTFLFMINERS